MMTQMALILTTQCLLHKVGHTGGALTGENLREVL